MEWTILEDGTYEQGYNMKNDESRKSLIANPNWYDYMHSLSFIEGNRIVMTEGGGQSIHFEAIGN